MGKLMSLHEWAKIRFLKPPSRPTLYKIAEQEPYCLRRGGRWYVDIEMEKRYTGVELVDKVLNNA